MDLMIFDRGRSLLLYSIVSTVSALGVLIHYVNDYSNFYTVGLALSKNGSFIVFGNFTVLLSLILGKLFQILVFGELRLLEIEHIYERSWFTVINSLMAMAMFRHENNLLIMVLVLGLIFMKVFHWILADRLDYIIQSSDDLKTAILNRCTFALLLFLYIDHKIVMSCIDQSFVHSGDLFVMFGLDFAMVYLNLLESTTNFVLNLVELKYLQMNPDEDNWEFKRWLSKPVEILISVVRVVAIVCEFIGLINAYKLPINFPGDIYMAVTKLIKQAKEFYYLVKSVKELEKNLKDASQEDLDRDEVCIICRYDMEIDDTRSKSHRSSPKKLCCGHVLHYGCLKSWLSRSKNCPTCRADVFQTNTTSFARDNQSRAQVNNADVLLAPELPQQGIHHGLHEGQAQDQDDVVQLQGDAHNNEELGGQFTIRLPRNALLPPDWTLLPLKRSTDEFSARRRYTVSLNSYTAADLRIVDNEPKYTTTDGEREAIVIGNFAE